MDLKKIGPHQQTNKLKFETSYPYRTLRDVFMGEKNIYKSIHVNYHHNHHSFIIYKNIRKSNIMKG